MVCCDSSNDFAELLIHGDFDFASLGAMPLNQLIVFRICSTNYLL